MKNALKLFSAAMLALALMVSVSFAGEKGKTEIKTSAYSWMCKNKIESNVNKLDGVSDAELDLETKTLIVEFDDVKIDSKKITQVIEDLGYEAKVKGDCEKMANTKDKKQR